MLLEATPIKKWVDTVALYCSFIRIWDFNKLLTLSIELKGELF